MTPLLRIACVGSLLLGAAAATPAAAQGRGDHDTPATQRQSESQGWQYRAPDCRTGGDRWVACRDQDGYWQRDPYDPRFGRTWRDNGEDAWSWGASRPLPPGVVIDNLRRWNFDDLHDMKLAGDVYRLRAIDPYGRPVRLTVDALSGQIIGSELR